MVKVISSSSYGDFDFDYQDREVDGIAWNEVENLMAPRQAAVVVCTDKLVKAQSKRIPIEPPPVIDFSSLGENITEAQ